MNDNKINKAPTDNKVMSVMLDASCALLACSKLCCF